MLPPSRGVDVPKRAWPNIISRFLQDGANHVAPRAKVSAECCRLTPERKSRHRQFFVRQPSVRFAAASNRWCVHNVFPANCGGFILNISGSVTFNSSGTHTFATSSLVSSFFFSAMFSYSCRLRSLTLPSSSTF